jgi:16S rRNA (guanine527-N7)-methyltransferase
MTEAAEPLGPSLASIAAHLELPMPAELIDRLLGYLALLQRWNRTYNLTAVREPAEMVKQHLADCLAVVRPLRRALESVAEPRLLDVGSGGGLPGAVIALMCPGWHVTCVDAVGKKAAFVRQAAAELRLQNLQAQHARVQSLPSGHYNLVTSRAFASLPDFVRLTRPQLADNGIWMAMKGKLPGEELEALPSNVDVFHVEQIKVPGLDAECLVWMRRPHPG